AAEHGGVGADADGQGEDRRKGETGRLGQLAYGVLQVLEHGMHENSPAGSYIAPGDTPGYSALLQPNPVGGKSFPINGLGCCSWKPSPACVFTIESDCPQTN